MGTCDNNRPFVGKGTKKLVKRKKRQRIEQSSIEKIILELPISRNIKRKFVMWNKINNYVWITILQTTGKTERNYQEMMKNKRNVCWFLMQAINYMPCIIANLLAGIRCRTIPACQNQVSPLAWTHIFIFIKGLTNNI